MKLKKEIRKVLKKHEEILVAYLYGSTVKGYGKKESDIDVRLLLKDNFEAEALYPAQIAGEIKKGMRLQSKRGRENSKKQTIPLPSPSD